MEALQKEEKKEAEVDVCGVLAKFDSTRAFSWVFCFFAQGLCFFDRFLRRFLSGHIGKWLPVAEWNAHSWGLSYLSIPYLASSSGLGVTCCRNASYTLNLTTNPRLPLRQPRIPGVVGI